MLRDSLWWRAEVRPDGSIASLVEAGPVSSECVSVRFVTAETRETAEAKIRLGMSRCTTRNAEIAIETVCHVTGVKEATLLGTSRYPSVSVARHLLAAMLRDVLGASYQEIGRVMGRDHTTAMNSCRRLQVMLATDKRDSRYLYHACEERLRTAIARRIPDAA